MWIPEEKGCNSLALCLWQYRERIIFISQRIDEDYSNQILATLLYLDTVDSSESLHMYINGSGGDVSFLWPISKISSFL